MGKSRQFYHKKGHITSIVIKTYSLFSFLIHLYLVHFVFVFVLYEINFNCKYVYFFCGHLYFWLFQSVFFVFVLEKLLLTCWTICSSRVLWPNARLFTFIHLWLISSSERSSFSSGMQAVLTCAIIAYWTDTSSLWLGTVSARTHN